MLIEPPSGTRGVPVRGRPTADRYPRHMAAIALSTKSLRTGGGIAEDIRDRNLSSLLGWLHRDGKHTRAELTHLSGLNRSTVGVVVRDLVALGLVSEGSAVVNGAGRPSPIVVPDESTVAIAVNPEVDRLNVGLVGFNGTVLRQAHIPWDRRITVTDVVEMTRAVVMGMTSDRDKPWRILGVGIAVPGQVRLADGFVREATHLGWSEEPLAAMMFAALGVPVYAANAAVLALRAESAFGAGRDIEDVFYIIGGASGIGGGAIMGGRLILGAQGNAGEVGHIFVADNGRRCHCGATGCLETEVSREELLAALGLTDREAELLAERIRANSDPAVEALINRYRLSITRAVRTVVNLFNPSTIIFGGFLASLTEGLLAEVAASAISSSRQGLRVLAGSVDSALLLVGAAELVYAELLASPASFVVAHTLRD